MADPRLRLRLTSPHHITSPRRVLQGAADVTIEGLTIQACPHSLFKSRVLSVLGFARWLCSLNRPSIYTSAKDAKLAQKLGQFQPFIAVLPQECTGQLASFAPTDFLT
jgi:hypothetical protein